MLKRFISVQEGTASQTLIKQSSFFCHLKMTLTVEEANAFIRQTKRQYTGHTNCSAYIVGSSGEFQRARDNGEPSGSGGLPILETLKQYHLSNVTAVVSRKFGGQLLGIPGLKRAYGGAVNKAILELGLAEWRLQTQISCRIPYHFVNQVDQAIHETDWIFLENIDYLEQVCLTCFVTHEDLDSFLTLLKDLTNGQVEFAQGDQRYVPYPLSDSLTSS